jgi:hypothetical protein
MNQKKVSIFIFLVICLPAIIFSQSNLLVIKDIYQGKSFKTFDSKIIKETDAYSGLGNCYLKFNNTNQYIYKSELEKVIDDEKILISYRDNYKFTNKETNYIYYLNKRDALLVITFYEDESSRCEILFNSIRQMYFESNELEVFFKYLRDSLDIINSIK